MRNTFGNLFTLTTFGESHGIAVGGVIDGFPAGIEIDMDFIQSELNRRRPGQSHITTARKEADKVEFLSGVFEGKSTGTPIGFEVRNQNQHSQDYENMRCLFRPSHADFTYHEKYGVRDHRGGGRSSARITIARCVGGALAKLALRQLGISITAYTSQVGSIALEKDYHLYDLNTIEDNPVRCPDQRKAKEMEDLIAQVKADGDTIGGIITCVIKGCPVGLGEPEFGKLHAQLGAAMLGINAVKGFEYGEGIERKIAQRLNTYVVGFGTDNVERKQKLENLINYVAPQDLRSFGLIPEIIGRLPILTNLEPLDRNALRRILSEPKNAIIKQYQKLFEMDGVKLVFEKDALDLIVDKSIEYKLGARGLRSLTETIVVDAMYESPSSKKKEFVVTREYALEKLNKANLDLLV